MRTPARASTRGRTVPLLALALALALASAGCRPPGPEAPSEEVVRLNTRGTAFLGQQKWAEAEAEFRKAAELAPRDPLPLNNIAVAKMQQGEIDRAEEALGQALRLDPDQPYAHYNRGLIEKNRGNFDAAAKHFEAVAAQDPLDLLTQYNLGVVWSRTDRNDDAERAFRAALARDPSHVSTLYGLGRLLLQGGDQAEGERLVSLSQEIRSRSGLDQAVGSQYGEQGPYAMGVDYPGDALAAPPPIAVTFAGLASGDPAAGDAGPRPWALVRAEAAGAATLLYGAGRRVRRLTAEGAADVAPDGPGTIVGLAAGNVDQDTAIELLALVAGPSGMAPALLRGSPAQGYVWQAGGFDGAGPAPAAPAGGLHADLVLLDRDHDGDLDAFWCWTSDTGAGCALATGDAQGNFRVSPMTDHGVGIDGAAPGPVRVAFSDFDNDRDVDLLVAEAGGVHLFSNRRDGGYDDVSAASGLGPNAGGGALEVADLNKDGFMDVVVAGAGGLRLLLNHRGRFDAPLTPAGGAAGAGLVVADYDNDGFLDLLAARDDAPPRALRNLGRGEFGEAPGVFAAGAADAIPLVAYDADGDGDLDLATGDPRGGVALLDNRGGDANTWIAVDSTGVGDNEQGVGSKVEILAGALRQKFEITDGRPLHAGLGRRDRVESVRYLWPSGVLQDELDLPAGEAVQITQLDRKGTSCPLLYARDDRGWRFVTDFLGGSAIGSQHARGVFGVPDTDEYVKVEGGIVAGDDGMLRLRMNNQLEEVLWFDQVQLLVVDHPAGTEVFPNERLMPGPPWPEARLYAGSDIRPVAARAVESGADLTAMLRDADGRFAEHFRQLPYKGYAETHTLELDLGRFPADQRAVLLLEGWIDYADSSSSIAAEQAGVAMLPPALSVADGRGGWTPAPRSIGFPAGLPKTMAVDLSGMFDRSGRERRARVVTNMRIYWDRVRLLVGGEDTPLAVRRVAPAAAELRFGGYPRPIRPAGRLPLAYDPDDVEPTAGWKAHVGAYTAFGDVLDRLERLDDRMVTTRNGDEIELAFPSPGPVPAGSTRTYLFFADGFGKDMDPNSAAADEVGPVPFHGMTAYPYGADVAPPRDPAPAERPSRLVLPSLAGWPGAPLPVSPDEARRGS